MDRTIGSRGGCGILINRKCAYNEFHINYDIDGIEAVWIKFKNSNIYVWGFYRSSNYCTIDKFLDYMTECMSKLQGKRVIWIGDINIDQNNIHSLSYRKLDMTLKSFNLVQTIQDITKRVAMRDNKVTSTTIDVIFTNCYSDFVYSTVLSDRNGDHQVIKCELQFKVQHAPKYEK